ncbi:hypothetical protein FQA39_LY09207 [Lamprigera yunnana]|nr:hypothetical protein FQA39_LY09207 [Lamprigera yunnana]
MELVENATNKCTINVCKLTEEKIVIVNKNTFDSDMGNEDNSKNFNALTVIDLNPEILTELIETPEQTKTYHTLVSCSTEEGIAEICTSFFEDCNIQPINPCRSFDVSEVTILSKAEGDQQMHALSTKITKMHILSAAMQKERVMRLVVVENATNKCTINVCKLTEEKIVIVNKNTFDSDMGNEDNSKNFNALTVIDLNPEILTELIETPEQTKTYHTLVSCSTEEGIAEICTSFFEDCNIQPINPCRSFDVSEVTILSKAEGDQKMHVEIQIDSDSPTSVIDKKTQYATEKKPKFFKGEVAIKKSAAAKARLRKIKYDPVFLAQFKEKERLKYLKKKEKGQRKCVKNMTLREQRKIKKKWKKYSSDYRKNQNNYIAQNTPLSSDEESSVGNRAPKPLNINLDQQTANTPLRQVETKRRSLHQRKFGNIRCRKNLLLLLS